MKLLDNTISYFDKPDKIDTMVREAKKNGYFEQIKQISRCVQGMPNSFDVNYKKKVHAYYKKKITKPFSLFQQPQYKRELRFYSDFNAFVRSIPDFQKIQEEPIYTMPEMGSLEKEVHSQTLVYDSAKKCDVSPDNIQRRKMRTVFVKNAEMQNAGIFTTKINFTDSLLRGRNIPESESRIGINLNTGNRSLSKSSYDSPLSPSKRVEKAKNLVRTKQKQRSQTINLKLLKSRRSNMSIHQSKQNQKQSIASSQKLYINQLSALQTLNRLSMSDHKLKNFRISKPKLHQLLIKRYGNQIITQFFIVQASQDISGVVKIIRQILCASPKLMQMLVFLTLDTNKDGIITEDQLNYLNNYITVQCALTDDINKVIEYSIQNTTIKPNNADLPLQFIKQPTYKEYLRICQENKQVETGSVRGIYRLFSFKGEKQDKNFGSNLPTIGQKTVDLNKKKIRINFETFQKIFNNEHPSFINDLATYLLGRNYSKQQDQTPSPHKTNISNKKHEGRSRKQTFMLDSTLKQKLLSFNSIHSNHSQQSNQLSRAQEILGKMHKDNKNLMTVQYD